MKIFKFQRTKKLLTFDIDYEVPIGVLLSATAELMDVSLRLHLN